MIFELVITFVQIIDLFRNAACYLKLSDVIPNPVFILVHYDL